jgi:hypothetical protein
MGIPDTLEFRTLSKFSPSLEKKEKKRILGQKASIQWKDAKDVSVKQKQPDTLVANFSTASAVYKRCRQKRAGLPPVSSRIVSECLRRTVGGHRLGYLPA